MLRSTFLSVLPVMMALVVRPALPPIHHGIDGSGGGGSLGDGARTVAPAANRIAHSGVRTSAARRQLTPCSTVARRVNGKMTRLCTAHPGQPHMEVQPGARVSEMPDGKWLIFEPSSTASEGPDVPWYLCALNPGPTMTCGGFTLTHPYSAPIPPTSPNPDNPPPPNSDLTTDNITRHWPIGSTVQYWFSYPTYNVQGTSHNIFVNLGGPGFTYVDFRAAVNQVMNLIAGNTAINISRSDQGYLTGPQYNYEPQAVAAAPPVQSIPPIPLVWDHCTNAVFVGTQNPTPYVGPTGNGKNEFIFLNNTDFSVIGAAGGFTSMLVDPATGLISECDVIYDAQARSALSGPGSLWNPTLGGPRWCTGIPQGVARFFGLDRTNLHPGLLSTFAPANASIGLGPIFPFPASLGMNYTTTGVHELPMTIGIPTQTTQDYITFLASNPLHPDDRAGLAQIYPVRQILGAKVPLINTTCTIQGVVRDLQGNPVWGPNVYNIPHFVGNTTVTPGVPKNGKIAGTARLSTLSVVGKNNTTTQAKCTGEFRIEGIPAQTGGAVQYDIVVEPLECIGIGHFTGHLGEWFFDSTYNPGGNLWPPALNATLCRGALMSFDILPVPSMAVTAGTILTLASSVTPGITTSIFDRVSRPLVEITPRTTYPTGFITISVHTNDDPSVNFPVVTCTLNGANFNLAPYYAGFTGSGLFTGGFVTLFAVPASLLVGAPLIVEVTARETSRGPGYPRVSGVNRVRY